MAPHPWANHQRLGLRDSAEGPATSEANHDLSRNYHMFHARRSLSGSAGSDRVELQMQASKGICRMLARPHVHVPPKVSNTGLRQVQGISLIAVASHAPQALFHDMMEAAALPPNKLGSNHDCSGSWLLLPPWLRPRAGTATLARTRTPGGGNDPGVQTGFL